MVDVSFPETAVYDALLNTGLIATYRLVQDRVLNAEGGLAVPDLAPVGVQGGYGTRIAAVALEIAAMGSEIDQGRYDAERVRLALARIAEGALSIRELAAAACGDGASRDARLTVSDIESL